MTWQPIETAPKDGRAILVYDRTPHSPQGFEFRVCAWDGRWWSWGPGNASYATHWMPLPDPPS